MVNAEDGESREGEWNKTKSIETCSIVVFVRNDVRFQVETCLARKWMVRHFERIEWGFVLVMERHAAF